MQMNLKLTILFLLPAAFMLLTACGGTQPLPDIEATVEARLNEERAIEATVEAKAQAIAKPIVDATAQAVPAAANVLPVLTVECTLDTEQLKVSCQAIGYQTESLLMWTSTASWAYGEGDQWQFTIDEELIAPTTQVSLEECQGSSCQTTNTLIDTSALVSKKTTSRAASTAPVGTYPSNSTDTLTHTSTPIPSPVLEPQPLLVLPFTMEHEPTGMMPMGETAIHSREAPWGHPGIDFQWPYKAPMIIALDGEIVQIISQDSRQPGLPEYTVAVITNEFIVNYEVIELYSVNPALEVGNQVVVGQLIGYATPIGLGDEMHMTHWSFGTHMKNDELKPNREGIVTLYYTEYLCPVPYFTELERQRLSRIWGIANYNERDQFPDLCNGPYKNY
jgi:hypothetical protein